MVKRTRAEILAAATGADPETIEPIRTGGAPPNFARYKPHKLTDEQFAKVKKAIDEQKKIAWMEKRRMFTNKNY